MPYAEHLLLQVHRCTSRTLLLRSSVSAVLFTRVIFHRGLRTKTLLEIVKTGYVRPRTLLKFPMLVGVSCAD